MKKKIASRALVLTTIGALIFGYVEKKEADQQRAIAEESIRLLEQSKKESIQSQNASYMLPDFEVIASRKQNSLH